ncbi:MAG: MFS transporter [Pseudomonadota bacterium]
MTVVLCFLATVVEGIDLLAIGLAAPAIGADFELAKAQVGLVFSATTVGMMIGAVIGGRLGDQIGRKRVLSVSVLTFGLFTFATAFSSDFSSLALMRFLTGLGIGGAMPMIATIASDIARPGQRAFVGTLMFCGLPVGGILAAMIAGVFPVDENWKNIFYVGGVTPLVLAAIIVALLPETSRTLATSDAPQALPPRQAIFGDGRLKTTVFVWGAYGATLVVTYLLLNWLPSLIVIKGFSSAQGAQASLGFTFGSLFGALGLGLSVTRFGLRIPMTVMYAVTAGAILGLAGATSMRDVILYSALGGAGASGTQFLLYAVTPGFYPANARGTGVGFSVAVGRIGAIVGPLYAGVILSGGGGISAVVTAILPVIAVAALCVFLLSYQPSED